MTLGTQGAFVKKIFGKKTAIWHTGAAMIGENCSIHVGSNVSASIYEGNFTSVGNRTNIGIPSNIAHDVTVGDNCEISGKVLVAGRAEIGNDVWLGAGCTISQRCKIGDRAWVRLGSTVVSNVPEDGDVSGSFAIGHNQNLKEYAKKRLRK